MSPIEEIVRLAAALGAADVGGPLSPAETELLALASASSATAPTKRAIDGLKRAIVAGADPLGEMFYEHRSAEERRQAGAIYTPVAIVGPMVAWTIKQGVTRIVDPGAGSGRYTAAVLRQRPSMSIVAIDLDPLATIMTRAAVAVLGGTAVEVLQADFTRTRLQQIDGVTTFLGNPPFVRHHQLTAANKAWAQKAAAVLGHKVSGLA